MPKLKVIKPGFQSTIQDLGRHGFSQFGISASGAADQVSLKFGNQLLGNEENTSAIEMTLVGGEFLFDDDAVIAITGSDFEPMLENKKISLWKTIKVKAGQILKFGVTKSGARCYLCISGGFIVQKVFGSSSTHLISGIGGFNGRALKKEDEIFYEGSKEKFVHKKVKEEIVNQFSSNKEIRVTKTIQSDHFSEETLKQFTSGEYIVSEESSRMGLRLLGSKLERVVNSDIVTEGVSLGAIQVSHDGTPIILFVEHQTTGGYPKIANVISADLHKVGQLRPRDVVKFSFVTIEEAYELRKKLDENISEHSIELA